LKIQAWEKWDGTQYPAGEGAEKKKKSRPVGGNVEGKRGREGLVKSGEEMPEKVHWIVRIIKTRSYTSFGVCH